MHHHRAHAPRTRRAHARAGTGGNDQIGLEQAHAPSASFAASMAEPDRRLVRPARNASHARSLRPLNAEHDQEVSVIAADDRRPHPLQRGAGGRRGEDPRPPDHQRQHDVRRGGPRVRGRVRGAAATADDARAGGRPASARWERIPTIVDSGTVRGHSPRRSRPRAVTTRGPGTNRQDEEGAARGALHEPATALEAPTRRSPGLIHACRPDLAARRPIRSSSRPPRTAPRNPATNAPADGEAALAGQRHSARVSTGSGQGGTPECNRPPALSGCAARADRPPGLAGPRDGGPRRRCRPLPRRGARGVGPIERKTAAALPRSAGLARQAKRDAR